MVAQEKQISEGEKLSTIRYMKLSCIFLNNFHTFLICLQQISRSSTGACENGYLFKQPTKYILCHFLDLFREMK